MKSPYAVFLRVLFCFIVLEFFISGTVTAKDVIAKDKKGTSHLAEPESIDQEWNELPKTYHPTTPKAAADWLNATVSSEPSPDKFSTSSELAHRDESIQNKINQKGTFGIVVEAHLDDIRIGRVPCRLSYSSNEGKLSYVLGSRSYTKYEYSSRPTDNLKKVILESKFSDHGDSVGQNGFGARVKVSRTNYTDISVAVSDMDDAGIASISPERARVIVPYLKCLVVFSPSPPFVLQQWDTKAATFNNPEQISTKDIVLFGRIENVWLFDSVTRQVLAKQH